MNNKKSQIFFGIALLIVFILSILVLSPFLITLALSVIAAVLLNPVYKRIVKIFFGNKSISSIITILLFYVVILIPVTLISMQVFKEAQSAYSSFGASDTSRIVNLNHVINTNLKPLVSNVDIHIEKYISDIYSWIVANMGALFSGTFSAFLQFLIITIALFFLLKDGENIQKSAKDLIPISRDAYEYLLKNLKTTINSVVFGSIAVAIVQGVISGIGFAIFGIPNATLWGIVATAAAFVPGFGTGALFVPMMIYAFLYGSLFDVFGLLLWAMIFINVIESVLRPAIIHKSINIHPLFVLFSILGGISLLGPAGSVIGPLILSLLFAMIRVYKMKEISISRES